jgi:hypothetical protein
MKGYMFKAGDKVIATYHPSSEMLNEIMTLAEHWETQGLNEPAWLIKEDNSFYYKEEWLLLVEPGDEDA